MDDLILLGKHEQACEFVVANDIYRVGPVADIMWTREGSKFRQAECFKDVAEHYKFVDYWRERGWPKFCRPDGDSFTCQ